MSEFDIEPVPGLPEQLPEGELLRWQGAPKWGALAVRALHVRTVAIYFGLLIAIRVGYVLMMGESAKVAVLSGLWLALLCSVAIATLSVAAFALARSTIYSITDRRLVIRFGVALPMAINIPFKAVQSAGLRRYGGGIGDIPLTLGDDHRVSYIILWPNVRPWRLLNPEPMLRCVPNVDQVAEILAEALREAAVDEPAEVAATPSENAPAGNDGASELGTAPATGR